MPYKYGYDERDKDSNVRGNAAREMTAIRKDDDADVVEKASRKMPTVASPTLQQSCKKTVSDCGYYSNLIPEQGLIVDL